MRMEGIQGMLNQETAGWIVGMCALVLLIGLGGRYMRRLAAVALRAAAGTAGIYCLDLLFMALGIGLHAGINLFNMLVVGVLGLPGIGLCTRFWRLKHCEKPIKRGKYGLVICAIDDCLGALL